MGTRCNVCIHGNLFTKASSKVDKANDNESVLNLKQIYSIFPFAIIQEGAIISASVTF